MSDRAVRLEKEREACCVPAGAPKCVTKIAVGGEESRVPIFVKWRLY